MPKLTIKKIESLIKRKEFGRHPDGNQLYLNIREPEGTASWGFRFTLNGKRPWHGFGSYDSKHSLQWAREQVLEFKALVKKGIDPRDHKRKEQESARQANNLNKNTFQRVAKKYIAENQSSWRSDVTKKQWPNSLRDYVYPIMGSKPVHLITIHDVLSVLRPIWSEKTMTATRVRSRIENILDYATTLEMNIKLKLFLFSILISVSSLSFAVDTDHDGLPDDWELANGRDPLVADYQISSGSNVVCVLDENDVKCWGSNWSGHLNVPQLQNPKHVSVGLTHACAIDFSGVSCWGNNWAGQTDVPNLVNPTLVEAGNGNTCALDDSGIVCWGWNDSGQSVVPNLVNPRHISVGNQHACALDDNGVACWGEDWAIPPELLNPTAISSGGYKTCAIDDTGVVCWGRSQFSYGALDVPDLSNPTSVVAGHAQNVCAFDDSGIVCWGRKDSAFLTDFPELKDPSMLCKTFRCALTGEGVITWFDEVTMGSSIPKLVFDADEDGYSSQREDSFNNREQDLYPLDGNEWFDTDTDGIGNNTDADDDGDGVLDSSDVWPLDYRYSLDSDSDGIADAYEDTNGLNKYLASDSASDTDEDGLTALQEFSLGTSPVSKDTDRDTLPDGWEFENERDPLVADYRVETNGNVACAVDDTGVVCWGWDLFLRNAPDLTNATQVGVGDKEYCALVGTDVLCWGAYKFVISSLNNPMQVAVGSDHACAIDDTGVICWRGMNVELPVPDTLINPRDLSAGYGDTCVIDDTGLVCWDTGGNIHTIIPELVNPKQVSLGGYFNCALDDTGVVCWDDSGNIQTNVPELTNPMQVAVGLNHACAIDDTGLVCWGANDHGQTSVPSSLRKPIQVSAGEGQTCILDVTGPVCWGYYASTNDIPSLLIDPDEDGYNNQNGIDAFPYDPNEWLDTDSDGMGNNADPDDDNDSVLDADDAFPFDASESADTDDDGVGDNADAFPTDANETLDGDLDNVGDNADNCVDVKNTDQLDADNDSLGNACDDDDDNDGITDEYDAFPLDTSEQIDTDADGIGNNADDDDDNDGATDNSDVYPLNNLYSADSDGDGMADAWELLYGLDPNDPSDASSDTDNDGAVALQEFIEGTIPAGSLDIDGNGQYDALTDGLLLLRGMFLLSGDPLISDAVAPDAAYKTSDEVTSRIDMLGDLVDIDGNGNVGALTDGLVILRYLFNLRGDVLINDVIASDATVKTAEDVEAKIEQLIPSL